MTYVSTNALAVGQQNMGSNGFFRKIIELHGISWGKSLAKKTGNRSDLSKLTTGRIVWPYWNRSAPSATLDVFFLNKNENEKKTQPSTLHSPRSKKISRFSRRSLYPPYPTIKNLDHVPLKTINNIHVARCSTCLFRWAPHGRHASSESRVTVDIRFAAGSGLAGLVRRSAWPWGPWTLGRWDVYILKKHGEITVPFIIMIWLWLWYDIYIYMSMIMIFFMIWLWYHYDMSYHWNMEKSTVITL